MIHHLSIAVQEPERVATVLAELMGGACIAFPPNPGAFMAIAQDRNGTAVEVHPSRTLLRPNGPTGTQFDRGDSDAGLSAAHFALSIGLSRREVQNIAAREGWPSFVCERGGDFGVIELWIENHYLVELLPPDFAAQYLNFTGRFIDSESPTELMASHARS